MSEPHAVLDVGSNTVRLLVARVDGTSIEPLLDESEFVRLGADVDRTGQLRADRETAGLQAIERFAAIAAERGVRSLTAIATSAVRDAANGRTFAERVRRDTGVDLQIISGEREAYLTYRGATLGVDVTAGVLVVDIGGGSAEIVSGDAHGIRWAVSQPLGSGRLTERFIHHDPPTPDEIGEVKQFVQSVLAAGQTAHPDHLIFTGGTATHVAMLAERSGAVVTLSREAVAAVAVLLARVPAAEVASRFQIRPERAQVLPAGVATLQAIASYFDAAEITVTRRGIREGTLVDSTEAAEERE